MKRPVSGCGNEKQGSENRVNIERMKAVFINENKYKRGE
jgi:hypothetical protein